MILTNRCTDHCDVSLFFAFAESDLANLGQLYRDERLKQKAESMRLDNCDKLHRLVGRQRGK